MLALIGVQLYGNSQRAETKSGGTVTVHSNELPDNLSITEVTDANLAADAQLKELPLHTSLGPVVRIEPGGMLDEPMDITFTLDPALTGLQLRAQRL